MIDFERQFYSQGWAWGQADIRLDLLVFRFRDELWEVPIKHISKTGVTRGQMSMEVDLMRSLGTRING